eukprot:16538-Heterococcus_DN1.PRE.1
MVQSLTNVHSILGWCLIVCQTYTSTKQAQFKTLHRIPHEAALATTTSTVEQECRAAYHLCVAERCHIRCCVGPYQYYTTAVYDIARASIALMYTACVLHTADSSSCLTQLIECRCWHDTCVHAALVQTADRIESCVINNWRHDNHYIGVQCRQISQELLNSRSSRVSHMYLHTVDAAALATHFT